MSTYSLSGSGTHALSSGTTGLQVSITTPSSVGGLGRSNPVAKYDQGLIRFSDGTAYWAPVPILGGPQFIPVPANATSIGYALIGGAVVSVIEVIGGTVFFSGGGGTLSPLTTKGDLWGFSSSDTRVPIGSNDQVLTADSTQTLGLKWAPVGAASLTTATGTLTGNVTLTNANQYYDGPSASLAAGTWLVTASVFVDLGAAIAVTARLWDGTNVFHEMAHQNAGGYADLHVHALVVLGGTTTMKVSAAALEAGTVMRATANWNGTSNKQCRLDAIKVA